MLDLEGLAEFLTFGFTLDGKTMRKELSIPTLPISEIEHNINSGIDDVYAALKESMERLIQPDTGLALSGGLDSRILAGITAELEEGIPAFTYGFSDFEKIVAHKIASVLKLPHYVINEETIDYVINKYTVEKLRYLVMETGGAAHISALLAQTYLSKNLKEHGIKTIISAFGFDEVNGAHFGYKISSTQDFCDVFVRTCAHPSLPYEYREIAKRNLSECCKNISFSKLYPLIYVKNLCRDYKVRDWVRSKTPIIDSKVLSTIISLPYKQRIHKRIQKAILRKYFPKLYKIPYAMSGLPPFLPCLSHNCIPKLMWILFGVTNKQKTRPLLTFDHQWFMRVNLPLLQKFLFPNVPPFMKTRTVQKIVYRLQTNGSIRDSFFLDRLSTYALLASQTN